MRVRTVIALSALAALFVFIGASTYIRFNSAANGTATPPLEFSPNPKRAKQLEDRLMLHLKPGMTKAEIEKAAGTSYYVVPRDQFPAYDFAEAWNFPLYKVTRKSKGVHDAGEGWVVLSVGFSSDGRAQQIFVTRPRPPVILHRT